LEISTIIPHIEVLIFASDKPLTSLDIVELINNSFGFLEERIMLDQVESALEGIKEKYDSEFYPFEVKESGGGWQFLTKKEYHKTIAQLNGDKFLKRLSNAALETLAIIAYKQPITKGEIEAIRGVNSDYSIQKLLEKELILISGRNEHAPGKPLVYATSKNFMDYFGINSAADLPKIREVLAEQLVEGTRPEDFTNQPIAEHIGYEPLEEETATENISSIAVNQDGELIIPEEDANSEESPTPPPPSDSTNHEDSKDPADEAGEEKSE
jgi:segregation and condensation protein B